MNDTIAGHVDLLIASSALIGPQLQGGSIRPLVQTAATPIGPLKDVRLLAESGFPNIPATAWWGVFAPAGTPSAVVERFGRDLKASLQDEKPAKQLTETQQMSVMAAGPEELRRFLAEQMRVWGAVVRDNDIKGET
jgi:tripartite-type tricarboxylate transporter receptor subunit TctC